ncbi:histidine phosphatase family protein [Nocardioides sp. DS6]|uniref:Histidine phosphatase family protein n=1 Tax=Nocardioides eburneus TaxID=3231482 RepID=A0ABV3SVY6_9ACTN
MATLILVRHGRTTANASGTLAGRLPGVKLDETGQAQAQRTGERLVPVPLARVVSSPLERCKQTTRLILAERDGEALPVVTERGLSECDYGEWQGQKIRDLAKERLWRTVQTQPSAAVFPGGEAMSAMQARAVAAVRRHDAAVQEEYGDAGVWLAVSHGDIIKSVLADALGMHLDLFQRISVDPASVSIIRYTETRPFVLATNTHAGDLSWLAPKKKTRRKGGPRGRAQSADAVVGGGAGPA